MVPSAPFVLQAAGNSYTAACYDPDGEHAMSIMAAAATALLPASQSRRRPSVSKDDGSFNSTEKSERGSRRPSGGAQVDAVALTHMQELLVMIRTEVLAPRFLRHLVAVVWIAILSAFVSMRRYELQAELFGLLLLGGVDVSRPGSKRLRFGQRAGILLFFEAVGITLDSGIALLTSSLAIPWQDRMTRSLHEAYFSGLTYYHARDLNSHERIGKDVPALAQEVANITCNAVFVLVRFLVLGVQLARHTLATPVRWRLTLVCTAPGLAAVVTLVQRRWPRVQAMQRQHRAVEAALRRHHDRLRRHSDAVAMCCGETVEAANLAKRMAALRRHGARALVASCAFDVGKGLAMRYGPHAVLMAVTLSAAQAGGDLLDGNGGFEAAARMAQSLRLLWDVLAHQLQAALQFMRVTQSSPHLFVLAARLGSFALDLRWRQGWQKAWDKSAVLTDCPNFVRFKDVTVCTPAGRVIVEQLNLRVDIGEHILIQGPHGSGKTSLARCLGSLWPAPVGSMALPGGQALGLARPGFLYLPARPLLGRGPTLQHQLALPCFPGQHVRELDSEEVTRLLQVVGLGGSADGKALALGSCSLAEQQRLGMAQLLYYRPTFAIMDDCTSALPPADEAALLRACSEADITLIAFMDVPRLQGHIFHRALCLTGGGKWSVVEQLQPVEMPRVEMSEVSEASTKNVSTCLPTSQPLGQRAVFMRLGFYAFQNLGWELLAAGATAVAAAAFGILRAVAAERAAAESAAALRAAVVGPAARQFLGSLLVKSALAGTAEAIASAVLTQLCARARLACRCWISTSLLQRCLTGAGGGRRYCLMNYRCSDGLDRVLTDDVQALTAGVWKLIADASRRFGDIAIYGRALWRTAALAGGDTKRFITFADLFSTDGLSLQDVVLGSRGVMLLVLSIAGLEFAIACLASGSGMSGDSTAIRHQKSAENLFFLAHSRLRREAERVAFAHTEAQERAALEEAINARAAAQHHQRRWEVFWSIVQQVVSRFTAQHLVWSLCVARCVQTSLTTSGMPASNRAAVFGDMLYNLRYISAIVLPLGSALGGWGEFRERWHVTAAPAARVHRLLSALRTEECQFRKDNTCQSESRRASMCACSSSCSSPRSLDRRRYGGSADAEVIEVDLQDSVAHRGVEAGSAVCRSHGNSSGERARLSRLTLDVRAGDGGLFICGPAGAGKSLVARALCGLWPAARGIVRPLPVGSTMYLAPWPHLTGETLLDHLTYPEPRQQLFSSEVTLRLERAMVAAEAAHLMDFVSGDVQASERWADSLSLDDRQRLAFARVLWHVPRFAVLDECTTALPLAVEANVLAACELAGITLIITSRRPPEFVHSCAQVLELDGDGGNWRLEDRRSDGPDTAIESFGM